MVSEPTTSVLRIPSVRSRLRRTLSIIRRDSSLYVMLLPVMVLFAIFMFWPMWWLLISFKDYYVLRGFGASPWVGFKYYLKFFTSRDCWMLIRNTILLNLYSIVFGFPAPIVFALLLNELRRTALQRAVQTITYLPHFISDVVVVGLVIEFLSPGTGSVNQVLKALGLEPIFFMAKEGFFRSIYIGSGIWQQTGWQSIVYLAALAGVEVELYEAAIVDGAGRWRQLWNVTLPSIIPTVIVMLILRIGFIMRVGFERVWLLGNEANRQVSEVIVTFTYRRGILQTDYSYATAVGLFNSAIAFVMVIGANYLSKKSTKTAIW